MRSDATSPAVVVFPPLLFAGTLLLGLGFHWLRPLPVLPTWWARSLGAALLVLGGLLVRAAEGAMKRAGTDPRPSRPSRAMVTDGPFRCSRNPMYLGTTGLYLGVSLLLNTGWPLLLLAPMLGVLRWGIVRREERYLEARFGEPYRAYRRRVRRWL